MLDFVAEIFFAISVGISRHSFEELNKSQKYNKFSG